MTHFIEKSIFITAPVFRVWGFLIKAELVREWAGAFYEGTYVESDFRVGSSVIWRTKDEEPGAVGKVTKSEENRLLEIAYYNDLNPDLQQEPGEYKETYTLSVIEKGVTLTVKAGPLPEEHYNMHEPLWTKALELMKSAAEGNRQE